MTRSSGVVVTGSDTDFERLRESFARHHCIVLRDLLDSALREELQIGMERDGFGADKVGESGLASSLGKYGAHGEDLRPGPTAELLRQLVNDPRLFAAVERITGCRPITRCIGRAYRLTPCGLDYPWHNDLEGDYDRMAALSINLSATPYQGGVFQVREAGSQRQTFEEEPTRFGDGMLTRIDAALEHRITPLEGSASKLTYSGWFVP